MGLLKVIILNFINVIFVRDKLYTRTVDPVIFIVFNPFSDSKQNITKINNNNKLLNEAISSKTPKLLPTQSIERSKPTKESWVQLNGDHWSSIVEEK